MTKDDDESLGCYFCDEQAEEVIEQHHIVPKRLRGFGMFSARKKKLCANCHYKFHNLVDPLVDEIMRGNRLESTVEMATGEDVSEEMWVVASVIGDHDSGPKGREKIISELLEWGYGEAEVTNVLKQMSRQGYIYEPSEGEVRISKHWELAVSGGDEREDS